MEHGVSVDNLKIEPVCKSLFEPDPILLFVTSMKLDLGLINNFEMWDRGGQGRCWGLITDTPGVWGDQAQGDSLQLENYIMRTAMGDNSGREQDLHKL